jgi:hypothetical protein
MTEQENNESVILKIKKLFALARKNPNPHESEAAAAKAQELLLRYNLSEQELDAFRSKQERITRQFYTGHQSPKGLQEVRWKIQLADAVAKNNLCKVVHHPYLKKISWIGTESNIEISKFLYETLVYDIEFLADKLWKDIMTLRELERTHEGMNLFKDPSLRTVHGRVWKKSFYLGMVKSLGERLTQNLNNLKADANINALVVSNSQALKEFVDQEFGRLGRGNWGSGGQLNGSAYRTGIEKGKTIQFKKGVSGYGGSIGPKQIGG